MEKWWVHKGTSETGINDMAENKDNYYNLIEYIIKLKISDGIPIDEMVEKLETIIRKLKKKDWMIKKRGMIMKNHPDDDKKNEEAHGQGVWMFSNGSKYVGETKNNIFHGKGTLTHPDKTTQTGEWKDGEFIE
jgi:hypothetical protein